MEELAMSQNVGALDQPQPLKEQHQSGNLSQSLRCEKSQWSVYQLYMVCAEKVMGLSLKENQEITNVTIQVFKGLTKIVQRYQKLVFELDSKNQRSSSELERNQIETQ